MIEKGNYEMNKDERKEKLMKALGVWIFHSFSFYMFSPFGDNCL